MSLLVSCRLPRDDENRRSIGLRSVLQKALVMLALHAGWNKSGRVFGFRWFSKVPGFGFCCLVVFGFLVVFRNVFLENAPCRVWFCKFALFLCPIVSSICLKTPRWGAGCKMCVYLKVSSRFPLRGCFFHALGIHQIICFWSFGGHP